MTLRFTDVNKGPSRLWFTYDKGKTCARPTTSRSSDSSALLQEPTTSLEANAKRLPSSLPRKRTDAKDVRCAYEPQMAD